jgi:hypothetical protein
VQHFPTAYIDDFEERANQLMAARHAQTQPPHTHARLINHVNIVIIILTSLMIAYSIIIM